MPEDLPFPAKGLVRAAPPLPAAAPAARFIGADVSKTWIDLADTTGRTAHVANTVEALTAAAIAGGRKPLRDVLPMAALTASRHNPVFKACPDRLGQTGTPHKVALIAALRKLVTTLDAIVQSGKPFQTPRPKTR